VPNTPIAPEACFLLPKDIEVLLHQQAANAGYEAVSEYLTDLIMREQERLSQQFRVAALLLEGLDSGEPVETTDDWWEQKRSSLGAQ
jgi:antitoxin ParD1/3/4